MATNRPVVAGVSGSRREGSNTRVAVRRALRAADDAGAETDHLDLRALDLPPFDPDADAPPVVVDLLERLRDADAILLGSPVYHGSYSATLKDALDWAGSDEFEDATVGLIAVAGGSTYATTLAHLRAVARSVHAWVLPHQVGLSGRAIDGGEVGDDGIEDRLVTLGREATRYARIQPEAAPVD